MTQEMLSNENSDMVVVTSGSHKFYLHYILKDNLDGIKNEVLKKDYDGFFVIDGPEGYGKSTLAMQCATYLDPTFNLERTVFTIDQFLEAVETAKKGEAIVFDETMGYLSARGAMSKFNRVLIKVFSEMRSKNLFIFLCIPSFFELDKYPAIHRSVSLLHVYKRGKLTAFNHSSKKALYIYGKKFYSYEKPHADWIGRFTKYFPLDKVEYEKKQFDRAQRKARVVHVAAKTTAEIKNTGRIVYSGFKPLEHQLGRRVVRTGIPRSALKRRIF